MFFLDAFLDLIFLHFMLIFARKVRFLDPFRDPLGPKMAPKITQVARIFGAPGSHFGRFGQNFDETLMKIGIIYRDFLLHFLAQFPPNPCLSKLPEQAETCRNTTPQRTKRWQHNRQP